MSDKPRWTPGPWIVAPSPWPTPPTIETQDGTLAICWLADIPGKSPLMANAHLIAAAPELYAALADIVDTTIDAEGEGYFDDAVAALSKARGEVE